MTTFKQYMGKTYVAYYNINDLLIAQKATIVKQHSNKLTGKFEAKLSNGLTAIKTISNDSQTVYIAI